MGLFFATLKNREKINLRQKHREASFTEHSNKYFIKVEIIRAPVHSI